MPIFSTFQPLSDCEIFANFRLNLYLVEDEGVVLLPQEVGHAVKHVDCQQQLQRVGKEMMPLAGLQLTLSCGMRSAITMNLSRLRLFWAVTLKLELTYQYRTRVVPAGAHWEHFESFHAYF